MTTVRQQIRGCTNCGLHNQCRLPVPYRGEPTEIMVLGEAPGEQEDEENQPFVGPAGRYLWNELAKVGLAEDNLFIANVVCCYPHRTPTEEEVKACDANLDAQIYLCDPDFILALGRTANMALGNHEPMGRLHGSWYEFGWAEDLGDEVVFRGIQVCACYHPAAVLRDRTLTRVFREDLKAFAQAVMA